MSLIPPLLATALVLAVIATALALFRAWHLNPATFQQRAGSIFRIIRRIISIPVANVFAIGTLILFIPVTVFFVTRNVACGKPANVSVKLS